jgi:hypothetical protein
MNANVAPDRMEVATSAFLKRPHRLLIGGKWVPAARRAFSSGPLGQAARRETSKAAL